MRKSIQFYSHVKINVLALTRAATTIMKIVKICAGTTCGECERKETVPALKMLKPF